MIVDDSSSFRQLLQTVLQPIAAKLVECETGEAALEAYSTEPTDWILMDVEMKGMDGLSATREIRNRFPTAKVLIVSQHDDDAFREEAQQAGAVGYLLKDDLLAVRRFIETHSQ